MISPREMQKNSSKKKKSIVKGHPLFCCVLFYPLALKVNNSSIFIVTMNYNLIMGRQATDAFLKTCNNCDRNSFFFLP